MQRRVKRCKGLADDIAGVLKVFQCTQLRTLHPRHRHIRTRLL